MLMRLFICYFLFSFILMRLHARFRDDIADFLRYCFIRCAFVFYGFRHAALSCAMRFLRFAADVDISYDAAQDISFRLR